jgi:hypothetical protein
VEDGTAGGWVPVEVQIPDQQINRVWSFGSAPLRRPLLPLHSRVKRTVRRVCSEFAVAFKLRFAEELVGGGFVGKFNCSMGVLHDVRVFITREAGFDIQQGALTPILIANLPGGTMGFRSTRRRLGAEALHIDLDMRPKVHFTAPNGRPEGMKAVVPVLLCIDRDDEATATADELIDAQIFKVTTVERYTNFSLGVARPNSS